jgi:ribonuclease ZC3H12
MAPKKFKKPSQRPVRKAPPKQKRAAPKKTKLLIGKARKDKVLVYDEDGCAYVNLMKPRGRKLANYTLNPGTSSSSKRMVFLDACNIGYAHAHHRAFSVEGLQIAIDYFERLGHECKAILPQMRRTHHHTTNPGLLDALYQQGKVVFTPCKDGATRSTSYDDRFLMDLANKLDGVIISNDQFRDLVNENDTYNRIIATRVVGYAWCKDVFLLPVDPYGRNGPSLSEILNK